MSTETQMYSAAFSGDSMRGPRNGTTHGVTAGFLKRDCKDIGNTPVVLNRVSHVLMFRGRSRLASPSYRRCLSRPWRHGIRTYVRGCLLPTKSPEATK